MSFTCNAKSYTQWRSTPDENTLVGPANSTVTGVMDHAVFKRVLAGTASKGGYAPAARPEFKLRRTVTLADGTKQPATLSLPSSFPQGMASADILAMLADMASACASQEVKDLYTNQDIYTA